jgi:hypothetical protein
MTRDGQKPVMLSAFVSQEFGFGMKHSLEDLKEVDECRQGKHCSDRSAAMENKRGALEKRKLTSSCFVVEFEHGVNDKGHWSCGHMVLQMEDCANVVAALCPEHDCVFLFDHTCGHDKRPDGLCSNSVQKEHEGKQPKMRDTRVQVGTIQRMHFVSGNVGLCWLTAEERESNRKDCPTRKKTKQL